VVADIGAVLHTNHFRAARTRRPYFARERHPNGRRRLRSEQLPRRWRGPGVAVARWAALAAERRAEPSPAPGSSTCAGGSDLMLARSFKRPPALHHGPLACKPTFAVAAFFAMALAGKHDLRSGFVGCRTEDRNNCLPAASTGTQPRACLSSQASTSPAFRSGG